MKIKSYDNSRRCPWCGSVVKRPNRQSLLHAELKCPYCSHHYVSQLDRDLFIIFTLIIIIIIVLLRLGFCYVNGAMVLAVVFFNVLNISESPMLRSRDIVMPERGYLAEIEIFEKGQKFSSNMIIPIVFVDDFDKPVSSYCCVRITKKEQKDGKLILELRLLYYGIVPERESNKIYMFNKQQKIARGYIIQTLKSEYR